MKKRNLAAAAVLAFAGSAMAQSSVSISGVLDAGVQRTSNILGSAVNKLEQRHEPSFLRFTGVEDLGGGLQARFALDMGVPLDTGNTTGFNREALVALGSTQWGYVALGRQYDTMVEIVGVDPPRFNSVSAVHVGNWDRTAGNYLNNVVKYRTPSLGGFTGTLMYSLREDGTSATNTGTSAGASGTYLSGPLRISAAWLRIDGITHRPFNDVGQTNLFGRTFAATTSTVVTNDHMAGIGAYYDLPGWRVLGNVTRSNLEAQNGATETYRTVSLGVVRDPNLLGFRPGVGVNYTTLAGSHYTSVFGILDYYFSRRTDVYLRVVSQNANGPANQRAALFLEGPSSTDRQTIVGVGMTTRF